MRLSVINLAKFSLFPLREKLRKLVASRESDLRFTPSSLAVPCPLELFFVLFQKDFVRVATTQATFCLVYEAAEELDFLLPPSDKDLQTNGTNHAYFGHNTQSRWYNQFFDANNASDMSPNTGEDVPRALHWAVLGSVFANYNRRCNTLGIQCS